MAADEELENGIAERRKETKLFKSGKHSIIPAC